MSLLFIARREIKTELRTGGEGVETGERSGHRGDGPQRGLRCPGRVRRVSGGVESGGGGGGECGRGRWGDRGDRWECDQHTGSGIRWERAFVGIVFGWRWRLWRCGGSALRVPPVSCAPWRRARLQIKQTCAPRTFVASTPTTWVYPSHWSPSHRGVDSFTRADISTKARVPNGKEHAVGEMFAEVFPKQAVSRSSPSSLWRYLFGQNVNTPCANAPMINGSVVSL